VSRVGEVIKINLRGKSYGTGVLGKGTSVKLKKIKTLTLTGKQPRTKWKKIGFTVCTETNHLEIGTPNSKRGWERRKEKLLELNPLKKE